MVARVGIHRDRCVLVRLRIEENVCPALKKMSEVRNVLTSAPEMCLLGLKNPRFTGLLTLRRPKYAYSAQKSKI
jgi:hypothetical protein